MREAGGIYVSHLCCSVAVGHWRPLAAAATVESAAGAVLYAGGLSPLKRYGGPALRQIKLSKRTCAAGRECKQNTTGHSVCVTQGESNCSGHGIQHNCFWFSALLNGGVTLYFDNEQPILYSLPRTYRIRRLVAIVVSFSSLLFT